MQTSGHSSVEKRSQLAEKSMDRRRSAELTTGTAITGETTEGTGGAGGGKAGGSIDTNAQRLFSRSGNGRTTFVDKHLASPEKCNLPKGKKKTPADENDNRRGVVLACWKGL